MKGEAGIIGGGARAANIEALGGGSDSDDERLKLNKGAGTGGDAVAVNGANGEGASDAVGGAGLACL